VVCVQVVDAGDDARTMGRRLKLIRQARRKSQEVVAGLAGMSTATLSRIENGLRSLVITRTDWSMCCVPGSKRW
jgi:DNA-binding XRE family transcriptional regulator